MIRGQDRRMEPGPPGEPFLSPRNGGRQGGWNEGSAGGDVHLMGQFQGAPPMAGNFQGSGNMDGQDGFNAPIGGDYPVGGGNFIGGDGAFGGSGGGNFGVAPMVGGNFGVAAPGASGGHVGGGHFRGGRVGRRGSFRKSGPSPDRRRRLDQFSDSSYSDEEPSNEKPVKGAGAEAEAMPEDSERDKAGETNGKRGRSAQGGRNRGGEPKRSRDRGDRLDRSRRTIVWDKSNAKFWQKLKEQTREQMDYLIDSVYTEEVKKSIGANAQLSQYSMVKCEAYLLNFEDRNFPIFKAEAQALATPGIELEDIAKRQLERIGSRLMKDNSGDKSHFRFKLNSYDAYLRAMVNRKALPIQWHDLRTLAFHWPPFEDEEEGRNWLQELIKRFYSLGACTVVLQKEGLRLEGEDAQDPHLIMAEEPFPPLVRSVLLVTFFFPETVDLLADLKITMDKRPLVVHRVRAVIGGYEKVLHQGFPLYVSLLPPQESTLTRPKDFVNIQGPGALARQFLGLPLAGPHDSKAKIKGPAGVDFDSNYSRGLSPSKQSYEDDGRKKERSRSRSRHRKDKKDAGDEKKTRDSSPGHHHRRKKHRSRSRSPRERKSRSKSRSKKHRKSSKAEKEAHEHVVSSTSGNDKGEEENIIKYFLTSSADEKPLDCEEVKKYFSKFGELDWCIQSGLNKMAAAFAFKDAGISVLVAGYGHRINKRAVILQPMGDHGPVGQPTVATEIGGEGKKNDASRGRHPNGGEGGESGEEVNAVCIQGFGFDVPQNIMPDLKNYVHSKAQQLGLQDFQGLATMEMRKSVSTNEYYSIVSFKDQRDMDSLLNHSSHVMTVGGVQKSLHFGPYQPLSADAELEEAKNTRSLFITNFPGQSSGIVISKEIVENHFRKHGSIQRVMLAARKTGYDGIMSAGKPGDLYALITYYNVTAAEAAIQSRHVIPGSAQPLAVTWYTRQEDWSDSNKKAKSDGVDATPPALSSHQQFDCATYPTSAASNPIQSSFVRPTATNFFGPASQNPNVSMFSVPPPIWSGANPNGSVAAGYPGAAPASSDPAPNFSTGSSGLPQFPNAVSTGGPPTSAPAPLSTKSVGDSASQGDGNDDPTNAILITGFSKERDYHDFSLFFRGIGRIRRCYLKSHETDSRWCVVTFENLVDAKKACTSAIKLSFQVKYHESDELTILPLNEHPLAPPEAFHACKPSFSSSRHHHREKVQHHPPTAQMPAVAAPPYPGVVPTGLGVPPMPMTQSPLPTGGYNPLFASTTAPPPAMPPAGMPPVGFSMPPPSAPMPGSANTYPYGY